MCSSDLLDLDQASAFLVKNVERDRGGNGDGDFLAAAQDAFFLDGAEHVERRRFRRTHMAGAAAVNADQAARLEQAGTEPLARQFQQPEMTDAPDLNARPVALHGVLGAALDRANVARMLHVDEVDDDKPRQIA